MSAPRQDRSLRWGRLFARAGARVRQDGGQAMLEYGGVLVLIAVVIGTVGSLGLPTTVAHAVTCEVQRLELNRCDSGSTGANPGSGAAAGSSGAVGGPAGVGKHAARKAPEQLRIGVVILLIWADVRQACW